jgi:hypothetical protein
MQRLDVREANLSDVTFSECDVAHLIADNSTFFGVYRPHVHQLVFYENDGRQKQLFDPVEISDWLDAHAAEKPLVNENIAALKLLERVCRVMLRQHMIKDHPTDAAGRFLKENYWPEIEKILAEHKMADRITKPSAGVAASFLRLRNPFAVLVHREDDPSIESIWRAVADIPA